jgi:hypothetical protein
MPTLQELEQATQNALDAITAAHQKLADIAKARDAILAEQDAEADKVRRAGGQNVTVQVPAALFKSKGG